MSKTQGVIWGLNDSFEDIDVFLLNISMLFMLHLILYIMFTLFFCLLDYTLGCPPAQ